MNILVLDVGTSSMRGVLMDRQGIVLHSCQIKYQPSFLSDGRAEQAPTDWENALITICKEMARQYTVDTVAITSQRSSVIPVGRDGKPLHDAIMWQDTRNSALCADLAAENDWVFRRCGSQINTVYSGGKMAWFRINQPELYKKTWKFMVIPDYLIYCMTGRSCTDHTYGSRSLLMDLHRRQWDPQLLELFGIPEEKLCSLVPPGSVVGTITQDFARATALRSGIPVISCGGDQQCSALGQGAFTPGRAAVNTGTGAFLISTIPQLPAQLRPDVVCNAAAEAGAYILESSVLTCCSAMDWLISTLYDGFDYDTLDKELAKSPPGTDGVICLPYLQGRSAPDWNSSARGMFYGITLGTTRADLLRALMEGICCEISSHIQRMAAYSPIEWVSASGGMTRSAVLNQMQADVYNKPVRLIDGSEASVQGAWMNAAVSLGLYADLGQAWARFGREEQIYLPRQDTQACYRTLKNAQERLYAAAFGAH